LLQTISAVLLKFVGTEDDVRMIHPEISYRVKQLLCYTKFKYSSLSSINLPLFLLAPAD
jgi:hypothetical protein